MAFPQDYISASAYFPNESNWGTLGSVFSGGGDTTIIISGGTTIINSTICSTVLNSFTIENNTYNGIITASAGSQSLSSGSLVFANSNGVTWGMDNGTITASVSAGGGGMTVSAGTQSATGSLSFANSNGLTFGMNASTITMSYNSTQFLNTGYTTHTHSQYINTSQSSLFQQTSQMTDYLGTGYTTHTHTQFNQALSGSNGSFSFQTATFGNLNGVSFYTSNGSMVASIAALTSQSNQAVSGSNGSFTFQTVTFGNLNGVSFYTSNGSLVASHDGLTSQSNQALSGSNGSFTFQTATFGNLNGASFYTNNGSMVLSYTVPGAMTFGDFYDGTFTTNNISLDNALLGQFELHFSTDGGGATLWGVDNFALTSQSNQALSGSNGSFTFQTATFGNLNGLSFYTSNGSMVGSYTVPTQTNQTIGLYASSQTTAQSSSSTVDARSVTIRGAGIVSVGLSAGEFIISATAASTSQSYVSFFEPWNAMGMQANGLGNATLSLARIHVPAAISASRLALLQLFTGSTGAVNGCSITYFAGMYTMSGSTASLLHSATHSISFDLNSNTNVTSAYGGQSGTRYRTLDIGNWNVTPGDYLVGIGMRISTSNTSVTVSHYCHPHVSIGPAVGGGNFADFFIHGAYSATTTNVPASIHLTDINQTGAAGQVRSPYFVLVGT